MKRYASVIRIHGRCWKPTNDHGYCSKAMRSKAGALRHARAMYPGLPVRIFEQGRMVYGRAELRLVEELPAK